jgi:hypothetical protein
VGVKAEFINPVPDEPTFTGDDHRIYGLGLNSIEET